MLETPKYPQMTREEVKVEFTGLAHDHLMASSRMQSVRANTLHHHHVSTSAASQHNATPPPQPPPLQQQQQQQQQQHATFGCLSSIQDKTNILQQQQQQQRSLTDAQALKQTNVNSAGSHQASALSTIAILRRQTMYDSLVLVKKFRPCLNGYTLEFPTSCEAGSDSQNVAMDATSAENQKQQQQQQPIADLGCGRTKLVSVYLDGDDPMYQSQRPAACNGGSLGVFSEGGDVVNVPINGLLDRLDNYDRHGVSIDSRVYAFAMGLKTAERFLTSSSEKEIQEAPPL